MPEQLADQMAAQIRTRVPEISATDGFNTPNWWLTFYLTGHPPSLQKCADELARKNWQNLGGAEGACLYAKKQIESTESAIVGLTIDTLELCSAHGIEIIHIDVDTSPEVTDSKFECLYIEHRPTTKLD